MYFFNQQRIGKWVSLAMGGWRRQDDPKPLRAVFQIGDNWVVVDTGETFATPEEARAEVDRQILAEDAEARLKDGDDDILSPTTTGDALNVAGILYGMSRLPGESDDDFRARIKASAVGYAP
jgi:hypothetical protein